VIRIFLILPLLAAAVLFLASLETVPLVSRGASISPASVAEARQLLHRNDPRRLRRGEQRTAQIPVALIDEAVNHLASRRMDGRGAFALTDEAGEFRFSVPIPLPGLSAARYLNLRASFQAEDGRARLASASLGSLPIAPRLLFEWLSVSLIEIAGLGEPWQLLRQAFRRLDFVPARRGVVAVAYAWEPGLLDGARAFAFHAGRHAGVSRPRSARWPSLLHCSTRSTPACP
jgi:hypothetical protein